MCGVSAKPFDLSKESHGESKQKKKKRSTLSTYSSTNNSTQYTVDYENHRLIRLHLFSLGHGNEKVE